MQGHSKKSSADKAMSDDEIFSIVEKKRKVKLEVVKSFGQHGSSNTTIREVTWALMHCGVDEGQARAWLTVKYRQQYNDSKTRDAVKHAMDGIYTGQKQPAAAGGAFSFPSISKLAEGQGQLNAEALDIQPCDTLVESPDPIPTTDLEWILGMFSHTPVDDPLIYLGTKYSGDIKPLSYWSTSRAFRDGKIVLCSDKIDGPRGFADQVVSNRMSKLHDLSSRSGGRNKAHCIDVSEVLTFEMDDANPAQQIGVINCLAECFPLVTVVDSGNKSLHATFSVLGLPEALLKSVFTLMYSLGADPSVLRPHQLSRLGCAHRLPKEGKLKQKEDGPFQQCLYMDSKARAREPDAIAVTKLVGQLDLGVVVEAEDANSISPFQLYFQQSANRYILEEGGRIHALPLSRVRAHLKDLGVGAGGEDDGKSKIESTIVEAEKYWKISYCGPLAGHAPGYYERNGVAYVCDQGPKLIESVKGDCSTILSWMSNMFAPQGWDSEIGDLQYHTMLSWLKVGVAALRDGSFQVGQLAALAGESGCGKSQFQSLVITPALGGRCANPFKYLSGQTDFNANLYGAEHLTLDDEALSKKTVGRVAFGQMLKGFLVAGDSGGFLHAKGLDGVNARVQQRLSMSLNDDESDLAVLPPMNVRSIADKIILIRCAGGAMPMPTKTNAEFGAFKEQIKKEMPAFLWYLLEEYEIPESIRHDRYGVGSYKNPDLVSVLGTDSDEDTLEVLIDELLFKGHTKPAWSGTTIGLKSELIQGSVTCPYSQQAKELLKGTPRRVNTLLTKLETQKPQRYSVVKGAGNKRFWTITR